jgi:outer membrane lipoprotein-sorting protein
MHKLILLLLLATSVFADEPAALLRTVDEFRNPLDSFAVDVELTSYTHDKSTSTSRFHVYGKGSDRSLVEFTFPQSDKGKCLLMTRDAMWVYMPGTSRPIRISPLQRLAGQASNGDVARTNFTVDYDAKSAAADGDAIVLDLAAKDPSVAYNRVKLWLSAKSHQPLRAEFYVVSGKLVKRATYGDFNEIGGRRVLTTISIDDMLRPGNRTVMTYSNLAARDNAEKMFNKDSLGKW